MRAEVLAALLVCGLTLLLVPACASKGVSARPSAETTETIPANALPDSAYHVDASLPAWVDEQTGYDTTRQWSLDGKSWPVCIVMSPSQSPQLLAGEEKGLYTDALKPFGITPTFEKLELPPRTFHALQRSKWAFVYMPYAVFVDYCRSNDNQGGAGGLQYVALAGSTQGGGYTLIARDSEIRTVADLAGKTVAGMENNPARIVLMQAAAEKAGLAVGDGEGDIHLVSGDSAQDLNDYLAGKYDAIVVLSIVRERFLRMGSHAVSEFTDTKYAPDYTILCVERSVLEQRPDVVDAFLEAHYAGQQLVKKQSREQYLSMLTNSWNGYFQSQNSVVAAQRVVPDVQSFETLLGSMEPDDRLDVQLLDDCFRYLDVHKMWGWDGGVQWSRLIAADRYDAVLKKHGEKPQ